MGRIGMHAALLNSSVVVWDGVGWSSLIGSLVNSEFGLTSEH